MFLLSLSRIINLEERNGMQIVPSCSKIYRGNSRISKVHAIFFNLSNLFRFNPRFHSSHYRDNSTIFYLILNVNYLNYRNTETNNH